MQFENISWKKHDLKSMIEAQIQINQFVITNQFMLTQHCKDKFICLQNDLDNYFKSTCDHCGHVNRKSSSDDEHITIKHKWGCFSTHDGEKHRLNLCCNCYDQYFLNTVPGTLINVTRWI